MSGTASTLPSILLSLVVYIFPTVVSFPQTDGTKAVSSEIEKSKMNSRAAQKNDPLDQQIKRIEELIVLRNWANAESALRRLQKECSTAVCEGKIHFAYAYLFHQKFLSLKHAADLDSSAFYYNQVLKVFPTNISAYNNLYMVYKQKGEISTAIDVLKTASRFDHVRNYNTAIGDLFLQENNFADALTHYRAALTKDPSLKLVHERLVSVYSKTDVAAEEILSHCKVLIDLGYNDIAINALQDLIEKEYLSIEQISEGTLLFWLSLSSEQDLRNISQVASSWDHSGINQLIELFRNPSGEANLEWWMSSEEVEITRGLKLRKDLVICHILRELGNRLLSENKIVPAEIVLVKAYRTIRGDDIYSFLAKTESIPTLFFYVAEDLGILYTQYPTLPGALQKFSELENELFNGKTRAYLEMSKEGVMKFHTTLGLIYAERNQWDGGRFRNGIYQLKSAISKSHEAKNTGHLRMLLAKGYLILNDVRGAQATLLGAAASFLNDDNFFATEKALAKYDSINGPKHKIYNKTRRILAFRQEIDNLTLRELNDIHNMESTVLKLTNEKEFQQYFFHIQRYKILSDLGSAALKQEGEKSSVYYHSKALEAANSLAAFSNLTDVLRLNAQIHSINQVVKFTRPLAQAIVQKTLGTHIGDLKTWKIFESGTFESKEVSQWNTIFTGSKIASLYGQMPSGRVWPEIVVESEDEVQVFELASKDPYMDQIKDLGIKVIRY